MLSHIHSFIKKSRKVILKGRNNEFSFQYKTGCKRKKKACPIIVKRCKLHVDKSFLAFSEFCIANNRYSTTSTDLVLSKENKKLLFNPDCYVGILLDYICQTVGVPKEEQENIDLLDEKLNFLNISMYPPNAEGIEIFNNRMTYYLAYRIDKVFQPLLAVDSHESDEFLNSTKRRSKRRSSLSATSKNSKNAIKNSLHTLPELSISTKRSPN